MYKEMFNVNSNWENLTILTINQELANQVLKKFMT